MKAGPAPFWKLRAKQAIMKATQKTAVVEPGLYQSGDITYRKARPEDDEALQAMLRENEMESWIRLSMESEPSYFSSTDTFGQTTTILGGKSSGAPVGVCSFDRMPVFINGKPELTGYLGKLRVAAEYRNRIRIIRGGFQVVRLLNTGSERLGYWFTSIAKENMAARRLLEARLRGMPLYRQRGELTTFAISSRAGRPRGILQPAQRHDIAELVNFYNRYARRFQYAPVLTESWLRQLNGAKGLALQDFRIVKEGGNIHACLALWDQRKIRQTVVRGYRFPLNLLRAPYNLLARCSRRIVLPPPGEKLNHIFVAFMAIDNQWQKYAAAIMDNALHEIKARNADIGLVGLSPMNPLSKSFEDYHKETYQTCIESVSWPGEDEPAIDPAPTQPEIAIL